MPSRDATADSVLLPPRKFKILLLTYVSPLEPWGGAPQRTRSLLAALNHCGDCEALVLSLGYQKSTRDQFMEEWLGSSHVMHLGIRIAGPLALPHFDIPSSYVTSEIAKHVDLSTYDLIVSRYIKPASKVVTPKDIPLLVDFDDAVYELPWKSIRGAKAWLSALVRLFNDRIILTFRLRYGALRNAHYFFCGSAEREAFPWLRASLLPNVPVHPARAGPPSFELPDKPALMFLGFLDYPPNRDAVDWFLAEIWPVVRSAVPEARFLIAGKATEQARQLWASHPQVEVLGFVEDLADVYARASASVVPMRSGGGTNIKALEAYHYGRMVIATSRVLEGHRPLFRSGADMLVADDARVFAEHCIRILKDPALARTIAASGYARIRNELASERFTEIVGAAVQNAITRRVPT